MKFEIRKLLSIADKIDILGVVENLHEIKSWDGEMDRVKKWITKIVPEYGFFPLIMAFIFNMIVYSGAKIIIHNRYHYDMTSRIDESIPFIPQTVLIYFGCYLFWGVNYIVIARQGKKEVYQFFVADFLSRCICFVIFLVFPTTNTRPEISMNGFWNQLMTFLYTVDSAENLFPSIHCLVSWFCYIGIRRNKKMPVWFRGGSLLAAILVFLATLTTKQHVIIDVFGGVLLAEICYWIGRHTGLYKTYGEIFDRITEQFFHNGRDKINEK